MATLKQDLSPKRAYRMIDQGYGRRGHGAGARDTQTKVLPIPVPVASKGPMRLEIDTQV